MTNMPYMPSNVFPSNLPSNVLPSNLPMVSPTAMPAQPMACPQMMPHCGCYPMFDPCCYPMVDPCCFPMYHPCCFPAFPHCC